MIWRTYKLGSDVMTMNDQLTLWTSEKGSVSITKGTLAVAVLSDGETEGYIFSGNGKLILDTIVETRSNRKTHPERNQRAFSDAWKPTTNRASLNTR
jgi:hypothetical protein